MRTFDRGDIVWIDFEPSVGTEQKGTRPALVLSPKEVNRMVGHFICVPISQGANLNRTLGFTVSLIGAGLSRHQRSNKSCRSCGAKRKIHRNSSSIYY